ncbi:MAG: LysR family transcriptional regulator [Treponema sp.]|jgi:DNA-binding transcriptional LysR family regulator|nr:LysR family transcriptional regulator [Treponema sp.]
MDHNQLRNFLAVCEEKLITKAADRCFISQQGLSKSLKALESELGLELFERSHRGGFRLTEFGEALESAARAYTNQHDYIIETMKELKEKGGSKLSVGMFSGLDRLFSSSFFGAFLAAHPDISLSLQILPPDICQKYVLEQRLQCCLSMIPALTFFCWRKRKFASLPEKTIPWRNDPPLRWGNSGERTLS